jgi:hypothetical protein
MRGGTRCCPSDLNYARDSSRSVGHGRPVAVRGTNGVEAKPSNYASLSPVRWAMWSSSHFSSVMVDNSDPSR